MARQFGALPGGQLSGHLALEGLDALVRCLQLPLRVLVVGGNALQLLDLFLDAFQLALRFRSSFHISVFSLRGCAVHGFHCRNPVQLRAGLLSEQRQFVTGAKRLRIGECDGVGSVNHPHAAAAAQLFHAIDERPVRQHIIAFSLHHHGEVAFALQVEEHAGLAFALLAERVKLVDQSQARRSPAAL